MDEYQQMLQEAKVALAKGSWKTALALAMEAQNLVPTELIPFLIQASALMDGGLFSQAMEELDKAELINPDDPVIITNRGICLFELCRFDSAEGVLELALELDKRIAQAYHYLGLLLERKGEWTRANKHLNKAVEYDPDVFSLPLAMDDEEFLTLVESAIQDLPPEAMNSLDHVEIEVKLLPEDRLLRAYDPPLSPQILGLGLKTPGSAKASIVVFQRNLQRIVHDKTGLVKQIQITISHELQQIHMTPNPPPRFFRSAGKRK